MPNPKPILFTDASRINAVQMEGVSLRHCGEQLSHFQDNCRLMMSVITAPPFWSVTSFQWGEACTKAARQTFGGHKDFEVAIEMASDKKRMKFETLTRKFMAEIVEKDLLQKDGIPEIRLKMTHSSKTLDQLLAGFPQEVSDIFSNVLRALTIQAWATFEAMTKELWQSVRDSSNKSFSRPTGQEWSNMKLGFDARSKIKDTFEFSFNNDPNIMNHLERSKIDPLALLRNILVHHGGKVDSKFKTAAAYHTSLKQFSTMGDNEIIPFNGPMVVSVIEPAITSGYNLIVAVDEWIEMHP